MNRTLHVNASNIHSGGGKVLLVDLIGAIKNSDEGVDANIYVDERMDIDAHLLGENLKIEKVKRTIFERIKVDFKIKKNISKNDITLHFGNIPPILNFSNYNSFLYLQNRLLIDKIKGEPRGAKLKIRILFEKLILKYCSRNVSKILVQTKTMKRIACNFGLSERKLVLAPFRHGIKNEKLSTRGTNKFKSFVYIASPESYKNHKNLLLAWVSLFQENIQPKLTLNIKRSEALRLVPEARVLENIEYKEIEDRESVFNLYKNSDALIYPSKIESFGLPLLEARDEGLDIIASEKDYVRDILSPNESFDPDSSESIAKAVKRYHGIDTFEKIYTPEEFLNLLLKSRIPKKVLVNGLSARLGGGVTYIQNLVDRKYIPEEVEVFFIGNERSFDYFKAVEGVTIIRSFFASYSLVTRIIWENIFLPIITQKMKIDFLICPAGIRPLFLSKNVKTVCISQNMLLFDDKQVARFPLLSQVKFKLIKLLQIYSFNNSNLNIFLSNFAKKEIEKRIMKKDGVVINHGVSDIFRAQEEIKKSPLATKYFLYVSHFYYYKSHIEVLKTWEKLIKNKDISHKLVLAGYSQTSYGKIVKKYVSDRGLTESVIFKEEVPQSELPSYYQGADLIIFASLCENCPNILIEGLGSGVPTISSKYGPMPEIAQDAALYFDPLDENSLYEILINFLENKSTEEFSKVAKNGLERSKEFDWEKCMKETWNSIQEIES